MPLIAKGKKGSKNISAIAPNILKKEPKPQFESYLNDVINKEI
jgi:hypothetical protein